MESKGNELSIVSLVTSKEEFIFIRNKRKITKTISRNMSAKV